MIRKIRTLKGIWGFGIAKSKYGWTLQFGPWCFTTEADDDDN